jgi:hypothetical protein
MDVFTHILCKSQLGGTFMSLFSDDQDGGASDVKRRAWLHGFLAGLLVCVLVMPLLTTGAHASSGYRSGKHNKVIGRHHGY